MPVKLHGFEFAETYDVTGEAPLPEVRNPEAQTFMPRTARMVVNFGRVDVHVFGPLISAQGKLLRKNGFTGFDLDDLDRENDESATLPAWAKPLLERGRDLLRHGITPAMQEPPVALTTFAAQMIQAMTEYDSERWAEIHRLAVAQRAQRRAQNRPAIKTQENPS